MSSPGQKSLFVAACALGLGTGIFFGKGPLIGAVTPVRSEDARAARSATSSVATDQEAAGAPFVTRDLILQRGLASCETAALWQWLESDPQCDEYILWATREELIDRLGWKIAWEHVLAIDNPSMRERMTDRMLATFSKRDPWQAYEAWKKHHTEFSDPTWGAKALVFCTPAASAISADKLLEVFQCVTGPDSHEMMVVEFAPDFDFRKVLDFISSSESQPYTEPENLLRTWTERSPEEAAAWLTTHPDYLKKEYHHGAALAVLQSIAGTPMDAESRGRALAALSLLPEEMLDQAWRNLAESCDQKITATTLETVDLAGRRSEYLKGALLETHSAEDLDDSWSLVPLDERLEALKAVEDEWKRGHPTVVDEKMHARWRAMVARKWGLTP